MINEYLFLNHFRLKRFVSFGQLVNGFFKIRCKIISFRAYIGAISRQMLAFPSFVATWMCFYMIYPSYLLICFFVVSSTIGRLGLRCPLSTCGRLLLRIALRLCLNTIVQTPKVCPIRAKCGCNFFSLDSCLKIAFFCYFSCISRRKAVPLQRLIRYISRNNHVLFTKHIR